MRILVTVLIIIFLDLLVFGAVFNIPIASAQGIVALLLFGIAMVALWEGIRLSMMPFDRTAAQDLHMGLYFLVGGSLTVILCYSYWWKPMVRQQSQPLTITATVRDVAQVTPRGSHYWLVIDRAPEILLVNAEANPEIVVTKPGQRIKCQLPRLGQTAEYPFPVLATSFDNLDLDFGHTATPPPSASNLRSRSPDRSSPDRIDPDLDTPPLTP